MSTATHVRQHNSILAAAEKRALIWMARRLPRWINSDHLSAVGLLSMAGAGLSWPRPTPP
jgi:archaetidylinositol phosphate synthase